MDDNDIFVNAMLIMFTGLILFSHYLDYYHSDIKIRNRNRFL